MIKLYYAPRTRAVRIVWLLEELGLSYQLQRVEFRPPVQRFFVQQSPLGKIPTLEDDGVVMCESGAIMEFLLERYGAQGLAPAIGSRERAAYLQWLHFAESTAFPPLGIVVWLVLYRGSRPDEAALIDDARERASAGFEFVERALEGRPYLVGDTFTAADIAMGFTLLAAQQLRVLTEPRFPRLTEYLHRLQQRPAFQRTLALG